MTISGEQEQCFTCSFVSSNLYSLYTVETPALCSCKNKQKQTNKKQPPPIFVIYCSNLIFLLMIKQFSGDHIIILFLHFLISLNTLRFYKIKVKLLLCEDYKSWLIFKLSLSKDKYESEKKLGVWMFLPFCKTVKKLYCLFLKLLFFF